MGRRRVRGGEGGCEAGEEWEVVREENRRWGKVEGRERELGWREGGQAGGDRSQMRDDSDER